MTDGPVRNRTGRAVPASHPVESLAGKVLSVLAKSRPAADQAFHSPDMDALHDALLEGSSVWRTEAMRLLKAPDVSLAQIIDDCVPLLARKLGARWCEDTLGFAEVSIGSARLQGLVRDADARLPAQDISIDSKNVAVVVRECEQHTFGASVLTSQLRRRGLSVRLMLGQTDDELVSGLRGWRPDAVFVSSASTETLRELSDFMRAARAATGRQSPIVLGGPVLELSDKSLSGTGADIVVSNLDDALQRCRLQGTPLPSRKGDLGLVHE